MNTRDIWFEPENERPAKSLSIQEWMARREMNKLFDRLCPHNTSTKNEPTDE